MEKIVGLGEILWDLFPDGAVLGGAPGNFAMHVNSLGMEGVVVSSIGTDKLGADVKDIFTNRSLKYCVNEVEYPTGTVVVELDKDGKASYDFTKNSAWDYLELTKEMIEISKSCSCVCFGSLGQRSEKSRKSIYQFLENTSHYCIRIFDINIRENYYSKEIIEESLKHATVLKLNDEELPLIQKLFNFPDSEEECLDVIKTRFDLDLIIVTKGSDGSLLYRSSKENNFYKPEKIKVVDTVGAGDSFTAAVAVGLLKGDSLETINKRANKVAAYVCTKKGGTPPLVGLDL